MLQDVKQSYDMGLKGNADEDVAGTPRSSNNSNAKKLHHGDSLDNAIGGEVDAFENPTELFQCINYGNDQSAALRAMKYPSEAKTWIVSRRQGEKGEAIVKWRYLPLHLACMKFNPSEDLIRALLFSYPSASRERDHSGNLPIHHVLSEGCESKNIIEMLLKANPESIDHRDRKGRSPIEIVAEGFRGQKFSKDTMVNILAILRQWTISEERSTSSRKRLVEQLGEPNFEGKLETRDSPPTESSPASTFTFEHVDKNRHSTKRATSRSRSNKDERRSAENSEIFRQTPFEERKNGKVESEKKTIERDGQARVRKSLEHRQDDALSERDILRNTIRKLKTENKNQEMALIALTQQLENTLLEHEKIKDKARKRKDRIEHLQIQLKERDERFENREQIFYDKEQKLKGKDMQLMELSDRVVKLVDENKKLKRNSDSENAHLSTRLLALEEENKGLRERVSKNKALQLRVKELEERLDFHGGEEGNIPSFKMQGRLLSRIKTLERELRERSGEETDGSISESSGKNLVEKERNAWREMNASLQKHVGALKERCKHLEKAAEDRNDLQQNIERLENELIQAKIKQSECEESMEQVRSESSVIESRLQTQVAKLEMELLEVRGQLDAEAAHSTNVDEEKSTEARHSLQMINESQKEHIAVLMAKCNTLEKSLAEIRDKNGKLTNELKATRIDTANNRSQIKDEVAVLREKNVVLAEELRSARFDDIGERQKELHSEFNDLFNLVKGMAKSGNGPRSSKDSTASSSEIDRLRSDNALLREKCVDLQSEIELMRTELQHLANIIASFEAVPESSMVESGRRRDEAFGVDRKDDSSKNAFAKQLETATQTVDFYREELKQLQEKLDFAMSTIANLREIISKNNGTYLATVELLTDEISDLRHTNESLQSHIDELSLENRDLRANTDEHHRTKLDDLTIRLNQVTGLLIALSLLLNDGTENIQSDRRGIELQDEVVRRQKSLLASDDREEILPLVSLIGRELRSGHHRPHSVNLSGQRDELKSISLELENIRSTQ